MNPELICTDFKQQQERDPYTQTKEFPSHYRSPRRQRTRKFIQAIESFEQQSTPSTPSPL